MGKSVYSTSIDFDALFIREVPYKQNIWQTLYLANEGKNRIGEILNWRSTLQQSISTYIANGKLYVMANFNLMTEKRSAKSPN